MNDDMIVELYWARNEDAISETHKKYGKYCYQIAHKILNSNADSEECMNDTYVSAWQSMPPHRPERLSTFLGKITRNLAINRIRRDGAKKRTARVDMILDEMAEVIPDSKTISSDLDNELALKDAINRFLAQLPIQTRIIFVRRYWYLSTIKEIASLMHMSQSNVKMILLRTRNKFKEFLEKEGIEI